MATVPVRRARTYWAEVGETGMHICTLSVSFYVVSFCCWDQFVTLFLSRSFFFHPFSSNSSIRFSDAMDFRDNNKDEFALDQEDSDRDWLDEDEDGDDGECVCFV